MKVLIIEDDTVTIDTVSLVFELSWPEIRIVSTTKGAGGIELIRKESPDIVILDLGLPDIDGIEVLQRIRQFSDVPLIVLTGRTQQSEIVKGLEAGADDYVAKPFDPMVLIARVKSILRRRSHMPGLADSKGTLVSGDLVIDIVTRKVTLVGKPVLLTAIEWSLLSYLQQNKDRVVPFKELWEKVWGSEFIEDISALRTAIWRLRVKLGDDGNTSSIITSYRGTGYQFVWPK